MDHFRHLPIWQALRVRDFRLVWLGESISTLGDQFYFVALPWLTLQITGSAIALGTVLMASAVPRGVLILFGGAIADRVPPRLLMLGSNAARAFLVGLLATLVLGGVAHLWHLYILAFFFGAVDALFYPAFDSIAPHLLDEDRLGAGNALLQGSAQICTLIGPALAGILIAVVGGNGGTGLAFAIDAASFGCATIALFLMRGGRSPVTGREADAGEIDHLSPVSGLIADIRAGISYAWREPVLRALLALLAAGSIAINSPMTVGLAILVRGRFSAGAGTFGALFTVLGVGALLGTLVAGTIKRPRHRGMMVIALGLAFGVGLAAIGLAPTVTLDFAVLGLLGIGNGYFGVVLFTWLQAQTRPDMLGRVMSVFSFAQFGVAPVALAGAGILAQWNVTFLFLVSGCVMFLAVLATAASKTLRTFD